ncbi:MAG: hypothetical protein M1833_005372 [Piccolia ochrophora]|nr:MAG: hypothetical protein M1833_005372 [Piccolia ochrophora]
MHFLSSSVLVAILAAISFTSGAALQPRDEPGIYLSPEIRNEGQAGSSIRNYERNRVRAHNGRLFVGSVGQFAIIICEHNDASNTTCFLNARQGPQTLYIDNTDGSLAYTAPNAQPPAGSNKYFSRRSDIEFGYTMGGGPERQNKFFLRDFIACKSTLQPLDYKLLTHDRTSYTSPGCADGGALLGLTPSGIPFNVQSVEQYPL